MRATRVLILIAALAAVACDPIKWSSSTEASGEYVHVSGTLSNASGEPTIRKVEVFLDGEPGLTSIAEDPPVASRWFSGQYVGKGYGSHRLTVRVESVAGTATYRTSDVIVSLNQVTGLFGGKLLTKITLPEKTAVIATSGSIEYQFQF